MQLEHIHPCDIVECEINIGGRCCTSCGARWSRPSASCSSAEVEIDEFFLGGHEEGLKGGHQHGRKVLVDAAIEIRGRGAGHLRIEVLPNSQAKPLEAFTKATTAKGAIVHTDGLFSIRAMSADSVIVVGARLELALRELGKNLCSDFYLDSPRRDFASIA
jgi:ISXO2-like transposase domain